MCFEPFQFCFATVQNVDFERIRNAVFEIKKIRPFDNKAFTFTLYHENGLYMLYVKPMLGLSTWPIMNHQYSHNLLRNNINDVTLV